MSSFAFITIAVTVVALLVCLTRFFQPFAVMDELGRTGGPWFDRQEDRPPEEHPDSSQNDPPIPFRRLRGRS